MKKLLLIALAAAIFFSGCSGKGTFRPAVTQVQNDVVFTLPGGETLEFRDNVFVWCGPWEANDVEVQTLFVMVGYDPDSSADSEPIWNLRAVVKDVAGGQTIQFPNTFVWNEPTGVDVFVGNPYFEYSTQGEGSSGYIRFQKVEAHEGGEIRFIVDAYIAPEYGSGDPVKMTGTFKARVGESPY